MLLVHSAFIYCRNNPIDKTDNSGYEEENASDSIKKLEQLCRSIINTASKCEHAPALSDNMTVTITVASEYSFISDEEEDSHNDTVERIVSGISYVTGALMGGVADVPILGKLISSFGGGYISDRLHGSLQDEIVNWFKIRAGTYLSVQCVYEEKRMIWGVVPETIKSTYEIRFYKGGYREVWFEYFYSGIVTDTKPKTRLGGYTCEIKN